MFPSILIRTRGLIMTKTLLLVTAALALVVQPALAADKPVDTLPTVNKCEKSFGTIAVTDGDSQGWTQFGLGSPRGLIAAIVAESGCFTMYSAASGVPATFLMSAIAGSKEEVNRTVEVAKTAAVQGLARSGLLNGIGGGGLSALGAFGGLGGKKKTVAAGLRVLSPATGMTVASGSGESSKSAITFGNTGGWGWANSAAGGATQYTSSKDGQLLASAFINAFNAVTNQADALDSVPAARAAAAAPGASAVPTTAVDTNLYAQPAKGAVVRALRAGTALTATGKKQGLFVEMKDSFGTQGWVSVEDLR
jgi:hypothetical protein